MRVPQWQTHKQHPEMDMPEATLELMLMTRLRSAFHVQGAACG